MIESRPMQTRLPDSYAALLNANVLKIDADTSDLAIWHGMSGILQTQRPLTIIVLEFAKARYADPGAFIDRIFVDSFHASQNHAGGQQSADHPRDHSCGPYK